MGVVASRGSDEILETFLEKSLPMSNCTPSRNNNQRPAIPTIVCLSLAIVLGLLSGFAFAQPTGLARYVPSDAGLFIQLDDLPAALHRYGDGPLHARLEENLAWSEWTQAESAGLHDISQSLANVLGISWREFTDDIVGGQIGLAIWPQTARAEGAAGNPLQRGTTLLILDTRDGKSLQKVAAGFRRLQTAAGLTWSEEIVNGVTIHVGRAHVGSAQPNDSRSGYVLAVVDELAILTDSRELCLEALQLVVSANDDAAVPSLAALPTFAEAESSMPSDADAFLFLNPQPWQAVLAAQAKNTPNDSQQDNVEEQPAMALALWESLRYGAAALNLTEQVEISAALQFDEANMPADLSAFLSSASGESAMLNAIPHDCLAAVAVHLDLRALPGWLSDPQQPNPLLEQIGGVIGPEFGAHLTAVGPADADLDQGSVSQSAINSDGSANAAPFPLAWVFEMSLRARFPVEELPKDVDSMLREALPEIVNVAYRVTSSSLFSNLHTLVDQGTQLSSLQEWTLFSAGENTTFGLKGSYVVASSSARAANEFARETTKPSLAGDPQFEDLLNRPVLDGSPNHMLLLNCRGLRNLLSQRGNEIAAAIAQAQSVSQDQAHLAISQMIEVLQLADVVSVTARVTENRVAISLLVVADDE